jgi:predicted dehydrogenase
VIKLGIIGTGGMANTHADRFNAIRGCKLVACADIAPGKAAAFAERHGIPAAYDDGDAMLRETALDAVSVVTTDDAHCEVTLKSLAKGLHVMCEKPLAENRKDARKMAAMARRKGVITAVNFSYRNSPATQKAAQLVASGRLGRIIHVEGCYLQTWLTSAVWGDWHEDHNWLWRLSTRHGSQGCLGDIGVHLYDLASFVVGDIKQLACELKTFDKGKKKIGPYVLDANDSFTATVNFANGALGTLHSSRWATGHVNTVALRVFGDKGSLDLNLDRQEDPLRACIGARQVRNAEWRPVKCPAAPDMYQRFITAIRTGVQGQTSLDTGANVQRYLDASFESAEKGMKYIRIR